MANKCEYCGLLILGEPVRCNQCGKIVCSEHRDSREEEGKVLICLCQFCQDIGYEIDSDWDKDSNQHFFIVKTKEEEDDDADDDSDEEDDEIDSMTIAEMKTEE